MAMEERLMYLPAGTSDQTIQNAISKLGAEGKPHAGRFGTFRTTNIKAMNRGTFRNDESAGSTSYVRLLVNTTSGAAYDALYAELGGVRLGD